MHMPFWYIEIAKPQSHSFTRLGMARQFPNMFDYLFDYAQYRMIDIERSVAFCVGISSARGNV